jgi:hypothetical protein
LPRQLYASDRTPSSVCNQLFLSGVDPPTNSTEKAAVPATWVWALIINVSCKPCMFRNECRILFRMIGAAENQGTGCMLCVYVCVYLLVSSCRVNAVDGLDPTRKKYGIGGNAGKRKGLIQNRAETIMIFLVWIRVQGDAT